MIHFDTIFEGARVPVWLRAFERAPLEAVEDLLVGRADLGLLSAEEPSSLLLDWLAGIGDREGFAREIDEALASWISSSWGNPALDKANQSASLTSVAWCRAADVIALGEGLVVSVKCLREHVTGDRRFLNALHEGRGRDPQGRAWFALARHQHDFGLVDHWWRLCRLPPDEPWYRGAYGLHGLRGLPPEDKSTKGGFALEVAEGLALLGCALWRRQEEGWVQPKLAENEFLRTARLTMAAFPFPKEWRTFWHNSVSRDVDPPPRQWVEQIAQLNHRHARNKLAKDKGPLDGPWSATYSKTPQHWKESVSRISVRLKNSDWSVVGEAEHLLEEQARFAEKTGDTYNVVRSACNFSSKLWKEQPGRAHKWADMARRYEPWNSHTWTASISALRGLRRNREALILSLQAVDLFPEVAEVRNNLAEVLKAEKRFQDAESVYQQTIEHFPDNKTARSGLAEVIKAQGDYAKAEEAYREATNRFQNDVVIRNGLAEALKNQGKFREAKSLYRDTITRFPVSYTKNARFALAKLLQEEKSIPKQSDDEFDELVSVYQELTYHFSKNPYAWTAWAEALKARRRFGDAKAKYREAIQRFKKSSEALCGLASVLREEGDLEGALSVYSDAVARFPKDVYARKCKRALLYELGRPNEAAAVFADFVQTTRDGASDATDLREDDVSILLADAYLLRRWRFQTIHHSVSLSTGELGQRARELLRQLMPLVRRDSRAASEAALLSFTQGDLKEAVELLSEASARFPGSLRVQFAFARAQRELARKRQRDFSAEAETELIVPWRRLSHIDEHCRPVQFLGEGRTWLNLRDGETVAGKARDAFGRLGHWLQRRIEPSHKKDNSNATTLEQVRERFVAIKGPDDFFGWWAREVQIHVFGEHPVSRAEDLEELGTLRQRLDRNSRTLDQIEEECIARFDRA